jgi:hypothetical protein
MRGLRHEEDEVPSELVQIAGGNWASGSRANAAD